MPVAIIITTQVFREKNSLVVTGISNIWRTASGEIDEADDAKYGFILRAVLHFLKGIKVV